MNPAGMNLFGYEREEVIGSQPDRLYFDSGERHAFLGELKKKEKIKDYELQFAKKKW